MQGPWWGGNGLSAVIVVLLCMFYLISNLSVSGSLSDFGMLSEVVLDLY